MPKLFPEQQQPQPLAGRVGSSKQPTISPSQVMDPQRPMDRDHLLKGTARRAVVNRPNTDA